MYFSYQLKREIKFLPFHTHHCRAWPWAGDVGPRLGPLVGSYPMLSLSMQILAMGVNLLSTTELLSNLPCFFSYPVCYAKLFVLYFSQASQDDCWFCVLLQWTGKIKVDCSSFFVFPPHSFFHFLSVVETPGGSIWTPTAGVVGTPGRFVRTPGSMVATPGGVIRMP